MPRRSRPIQRIVHHPASSHPWRLLDVVHSVILVARQFIKIHWPVAAFSALYFPVTLLLASRRMLWNDELFTLYIARRSSLPAICEALLSGADQNPPLFYWLSHAASLTASPSSPVGLRLPGVFGFWLLGACLAWCFSLRNQPTYGLFASLLVMSSGAYMYAYEARPYGLVAGLSASALLFWSRSLKSPGSRWFVAGLSISLAGAVASHYYAVLLLLPLAAGEAARTWQSRAIHWRTLAAFIPALCVLIAHWPFIHAALSYSGTFWAKATPASAINFYSFLLLPAVAPLLLTAAVAGLYPAVSKPSSQAPPLALNFAEGAALLACAALPFAAVAIAMLITGAYTDRYVIAAAAGIVIAIVSLAGGLLRWQTAPAAALCAALAIFTLAHELRFSRFISKLGDRRPLAAYLDAQLPAIRIGIDDPHLFLELYHQSGEAMRKRIFYVADRQLALERLGTDAVDHSAIDLQPFAGYRIERLQPLLESGGPVAIYGYPAQWGWLTDELASRKANLEVVGTFDKRLLAIYNPKPASR